MMKYSLSSILLLLCSLILAQPGLALQEQRIKFDIDHASFRDSEANNRLEVYYSFYANQFTFVDQDTQRSATFNIDAQIFQADSIVATRNWNSGAVGRVGTEETQGQMFFTLSHFTLPAGQYRYVTRISDLNSNLEGSKEIAIEVPSFLSDDLLISDIQLASSLTKDATQNIFTKNSYNVVPNPGALFGPRNPMLYFYAEIYNLHPDDGTQYSLQYSILDAAGNLVRSFPEQLRAKPGTSAVEVGGFNVISFPSGSYTLQLKVSDLATHATTMRTSPFFTYKLGISRTSAAENLSRRLRQEFEAKSLEELNNEFATARHLTNPQDRKAFESLSLEEKRAFLVDFWLQRASQRAGHLERLRFANQNYGGFQPGWKADRGRIIVHYGPPDEREKGFNGLNQKAYEIWRYYNYSQDGALIFVFVDKEGFDQLELIHSNARGEVADPDWQRWITE